MLRPIRKYALPVLMALTVASIAGCSRQARKERYQSRADHYFDAGKYPQAEVEYLNVLRLDPTNAHAIGRLGVIYFDDGQLPKAYPLLRKAAELEPDDLMVRLRSGMLHLAEGHLQVARADAEAILSRAPTNEDAPLLLARSARTRDDLRNVQQRLQDLLRQTGGSASLNVALGTVLQMQGDLPGAKTAIQRALKLDSASSAAHYAMGTLYLTQTNLTKADEEFKTAAQLAPPRSARRLEYADFKIRTGHVDEAKDILTQVTKSTPDYLPAWLQLARIALAQKQAEVCKSMINQVMVRDPDNYDALSLSATVELSAGRTDKAINILERLKTIYSRAPQPRYSLALASLAQGDSAKALRNLDEAINLNTNFINAILLKAQINIRRDNAASAITDLEQLIQRHPQLVQANLLLAAAYSAADRFDDALAIYRHLQQLQPTNSDIPLLIGVVLQRQGKRDEARNSFEKALAQAPDYLPALEQLVRLDLADRKYDAARSRIQSRLDKDPNSPQLQYLLAQACVAQQDTNAAESALERAISSAPDFQAAYMLLAQLYADNNQNKKALEKIGEALEKNPHDSSALLLKGMIENEERDYSAARATYEKLLAVSPDSIVALNNLAYLYSEKFDLLDKAYEAARKAKDLLSSIPTASSPAVASTDDTLGWILYKRGEYRWALGLLQDSASRLPHEPEVQYHLGMTYYMMGDEIRARRALKEAISMPKDFPEKAAATNRLALLDLDPRTAGSKEIAMLEAQVRTQPDDPVALGHLAQIYCREGSPEKAAEAYAQALRMNPKNARLMTGLALLDAEHLNQLDKAMALAKDAHKLAPDDANVSYALGRLAFETGDHKWAVSLLELSERRKPNDAAVRYDLARAYYSIGRVSDAESTMRSALQAVPPSTRAAEGKQFLELIALPEDPAKAMKAEAEARQILRTNATCVPALMVLAVAAEQRSDTNTARQTYEKVLKHYPEFVPAIKRLTLLNSRVAPADQETYALAMKAREALPTDPEVAKALGIILYHRADYRGAVRLLTESIGNRSADGESLCYLGMAQYRLKETKECQKTLQRALAMDVPAPLAKEARRVMAELQQ